MAFPPVTVETLYRQYSGRLRLEWVAGRTGGDKPIVPAGMEPAGISLIGHLNFISPHRIQALGDSEFAYLESLGKNSHDDALEHLFGGDSVMVIVTNDRPVPEELMQLADAHGTALFRSPLRTEKLIDHLNYYLTGLLADKLVAHGVFMDVMGIGVLLTGESAIGKSELALELISRGHRLVADDAPEFVRTDPDTLHGRCPELLRDFLEVRGLGILNIRAMFGDSAIKQGKNLRLIINLKPVGQQAMSDDSRLLGSRHTRQLLEVDVAEIELPVAPGRNLAVLVEAAARNQILSHNGYDAGADFMERQRQQMERE